MADDGIRVRYSGLIIFTAQMISVATGLAFTLLLTRNMTTQGFSDWSFIYTAIGPFLFLTGVFPFWTTRFVARRKENSIKTGLAANLILGVAATVGYCVFLPIYFGTFNVNPGLFDIFLFASLLILTSYVTIMLESCLRSVKPQTTGYGLLVHEIIKVTIAYTVFFLFIKGEPAAVIDSHTLFSGAMASLLIAVFVQIAYYMWLLRDALKEKIRFAYLVEWLKGSAVFVYSTIGTQILSLQAFMIYAVNKDSLGHYTAASMFINVVAYATSLSFALYPKLLSNNCEDKHVVTSFSTTMMMAIPLATVVISMSKSLLTVLNVNYVESWPVLIMLTVATVLSLVSTFYINYLTGVESFDIGGKISLRELLKSKIFKALSLTYLQAGITIPLTFIAITMFPISNPVVVAEYVGVIAIIMNVVNLIVSYWLVHKYAGKVFINMKDIAKYLAVGVVMGATLFLLPETTTLVFTLLKASLGAGIYFGLLLLIDEQARHMVKLVFVEIKQILRMKPKNPI
ncbi:MAG: hypothetical protein NWF01_02060 [Candidatus Bathyarchaeota archaeon]|nr:hypothetical protein [Candidatus Bathyarchaeota archaeon]